MHIKTGDKILQEVSTKNYRCCFCYAINKNGRFCLLSIFFLKRNFGEWCSRQKSDKMQPFIQEITVTVIMYNFLFCVCERKSQKRYKLFRIRQSTLFLSTISHLKLYSIFPKIQNKTEFFSDQSCSDLRLITSRIGHSIGLLMTIFHRLRHGLPSSAGFVASIDKRKLVTRNLSFHDQLG